MKRIKQNKYGIILVFMIIIYVCLFPVSSYAETRDTTNYCPSFMDEESISKNGISFIRNVDNTISVKGTASENSGITRVLELPAGEYLLTGCPIGGTVDSYFLYVSYYDRGGVYIGEYDDFGEGCTIRINDNYKYKITIRIKKDTIIDDAVIFKPSIVARTIENSKDNYIAITKNESTGKQAQKRIIYPTIEGMGTIISNGKTITENDKISHTGYIEVEPNTIVTITNFYPTTMSGILLYDNNQISMGRIRCKVNGSTIPSFTILIPERVRYIRYNVTNTYANLTTVIINDDNGELNIQNNYKILEGHKLSHGPIITIIDDDTASLYQVETFHDICELYGIKGTYAVITDNLLNVNGLKDTLLQYEIEGYHIVTHCKEQKPYLKQRDSESQKLIYANMVTAKREMQNAGFINFDYWCSPYGMHDSFSQKLAKDLGFKCLVSLPQLTYEGYTPLQDRWFIPRMELYPTDSEGNQTLQDIKDQIDQCVDTNGWLLIATHLYQWPKEDVATGYIRIKEMIQYALDSGMTFMTLAEAFEYWRPIYDLYEVIY